MTNTRIFGYADPLAARAGSKVDFMISVEGRDEVEARLVRVLHGDENPDGPGYLEEAVSIDLPKSLKVKRQFTQVGSFARADDPEGKLDGLASFTLFAHVFPTLPKAERQQVLGRWDIEGSKGFGLGIDPDGHVAMWLGDGAGVDEIRTEITLVPRCWYFVAASYDAATKQAELHVINCVTQWNSRISTVVPFEGDSWIKETLRHGPGATKGDASFKLASATAYNPVRGHYGAFLFNGKIDRAGVYDRPLTRDVVMSLAKGNAPDRAGLLAYWDPTANLAREGVGDTHPPTTGPHGLHMQAVNRLRPLHDRVQLEGRGKLSPCTGNLRRRALP